MHHKLRGRSRMAVGREWPTARSWRPRPRNLEKGASAITSTAHSRSGAVVGRADGQPSSQALQPVPRTRRRRALRRGHVWAPTLLPQEHCSASGSRRPDHRVSLQPGVLVFPTRQVIIPAHMGSSRSALQAASPRNGRCGPLHAAGPSPGKSVASLELPLLPASRGGGPGWPWTEALACYSG